MHTRKRRRERMYHIYHVFLLKILQETFKGSNLTRVGTLRKKETKTEVPMILEKSHMSVLSVETPLRTLLASRDTRGSILVKSHMSVLSVETPLRTCLLSRNTRGSILVKSHISALLVGRV